MLRRRAAANDHVGVVKLKTWLAAMVSAGRRVLVGHLRGEDVTVHVSSGAKFGVGVEREGRRAAGHVAAWLPLVAHEIVNQSRRRSPAR